MTIIGIIIAIIIVGKVLGNNKAHHNPYDNPGVYDDYLNDEKLHNDDNQDCS